MRDIEICLGAMQNKLYHIGIRSKISRSTLADANQNRDWRIYAGFAYILIDIAKELYRDDKFFKELNETVYALGSTTIDLCLSLFPWAKFRQTKSAIKIRTLLNLQNNIPAFISITGGSVHDVNILDELIAEIGAFYVVDKSYIDFERPYKLNIRSAYFVTRAKSNLHFKRVYSHQADESLGLICDQSIFLNGFYPSKHYPDKLRRIKYFDSQNNKRPIFLAIIKKKLKIEHSLYTFLHLVSISIFEKMPIISMFSDSNYKMKLTITIRDFWKISFVISTPSGARGRNLFQGIQRVCDLWRFR